MINIERIIEYLEKNGQSKFEDIWNKTKNDFLNDFSDSIIDEPMLKTDVYLSLNNDERTVLFLDEESNEKLFDLVKKYSYSELQKIKLTWMGEKDILNEQLDESIVTDKTEEISIVELSKIEEEKVNLNEEIIEVLDEKI